jgi:hypothetical protein
MGEDLIGLNLSSPLYPALWIDDLVVDPGQPGQWECRNRAGRAGPLGGETGLTDIPSEAGSFGVERVAAP